MTFLTSHTLGHYISTMMWAMIHVCLLCVVCLTLQYVKLSFCCHWIQELARPHFSFFHLSTPAFVIHSCGFRVWSFVPSVVSKSSPLFCWDLNIFPFFFLLPFLSVFHCVQPNPLVAKHWLMALLAFQRERVHDSLGAVDLPNHLPVTLHPPSPCSPTSSLQILPITQPFSEVIWGSLEREEPPLRVHLGRQKGLELYSLSSIANKAKPCEWRQSLFSVLWLILLVCWRGEKRCDGERIREETVCVWCRLPE